MRFPRKTVICLLIVTGVVLPIYLFVPAYLKELRKPRFRQAEVSRGSIVAVVNATGTVKPVLSISVGSFVSGPIDGLHVDYNDVVREGQVLATIDPRIYEAALERDKAELANREAELSRVRVLLIEAKRDRERAKNLRDLNERYISVAEMDQVNYKVMALEAQMYVADAQVNQAAANKLNSEANLEYTKIRSPVNGLIIDRKIDQGQTLAASFQTPELFIVAPDLETMHIHATVDEADIGLITKAKLRQLPVHFTIDAYPHDLFEGKILQIRKSSATTENVVTYPVIVEARNQTIDVPSGCDSQVPEFKLMPGMTASLTFQVDESEEELRIPNAALRFYPEKYLVRPEDRKLLEGEEDDDEQDNADTKMTATETASLRKKSRKRHVWVVDGDFLKAIEVVTGLSNNRYTQLVSGDLQEDQPLVTGIKSRD